VRDGVLRIEMIYGVTISDDLLAGNPLAQREILRRDILQAANDVINDTDFTEVIITDGTETA